MCPNICNSPFYYLLMRLKYCCMYSKQCRLDQTLHSAASDVCLHFLLFVSILGLLQYSNQIYKIMLDIFLTKFINLPIKRQSQQLSSALSSASYFKSHCCKQCRPRSDCSFRSSLIWVHTVCLYAKCKFEKFTRRCSRRHKQTTFSDADFLGALRFKEENFYSTALYNLKSSGWPSSLPVQEHQCGCVQQSEK